MIFTFYSYKGGVGRSMALANVAEWFYQQGLSVVIVDWDLEAPRLENFFFDSPEDRKTIQSQPSIIDLLTSYQNRFPHLPILENKIQDNTDPIRVLDKYFYLPFLDNKIQDNADLVRVLDKYLLPIKNILYPVYSSELSNHNEGIENKKNPALWLLTAGCRSGDRFSTYAHTVQSFDWSNFYREYKGEIFFEWMRTQLLDNADVVLIDSRTGVTEMGGVCTRQLADVVVTLFTPNLKNLDNVIAMVKSFGRDEVIRAREGRSLNTIIVPARLDENENELRNEFRNWFNSNAQVRDIIPKNFKKFRTNFWNLGINYVPYYAWRETLAISGPGREGNEKLEEQYRILALHMGLLAPESSELYKRLTPWIKRRLIPWIESKLPLPRIYISYDPTDGKELAEKLHKRLIGVVLPCGRI